MKYFAIISTLCLAINCFGYEQNNVDGTIGGHEYVDLGLPSGTLWATYNVGATSPYEKGDYFAWGEVEPREDFSWESHKYFIDYHYDPIEGAWPVFEDIGDDISGTEYDAARHQWGNGWRLPNEQERYELRMLCWWNSSVIENGVRGVRIHGPNEHSIFLPVCGYGLWYGEEDPFHSSKASYMTGVEYPVYSINGLPIEPSYRVVSMLVDSSGFTGASSRKASGLNIRAVVNPRELGIDGVVSDSRRTTVSYRDGCIHISGSHADGMITAYDLSGRQVFSGHVSDGVCQMSGLAGGIYLVSYADNGETVTTQKITIK